MQSFPFPIQLLVLLMSLSTMSCSLWLLLESWAGPWPSTPFSREFRTFLLSGGLWFTITSRTGFPKLHGFMGGRKLRGCGQRFQWLADPQSQCWEHTSHRGPWGQLVVLSSLEFQLYHNMFSILSLKTWLNPFLFSLFRNCWQFAFHLEANFPSSNKYVIVLC